jgi:hypothetical protein
MDVAQIALPLYIHRCQAILRALLREDNADQTPRSSPKRPARGHASDGGVVTVAASSAAAPHHADLAVSVLQTLRALQLSPAVVDAALPGVDQLQAQLTMVRALRDRRRGDEDDLGASSSGTLAAPHGGMQREQTHLLVLFPEVTACVRLQDRAVREAAADVLAVAADLLGLADRDAKGQDVG